MEGFYRKKGVARKSLAKDKKQFFWARTLSFWDEGTAWVLSCRLPLLPLVGQGWDREGPCDRLPY